MGTLGCINDMLQRDKENRALRKLSRGRMREHYKYLVKRKGPERADVTIEEIEEIRRNTTEKELSDKEHLFRAKTILAACALVLLLLGVLCYQLYSSAVVNPIDKKSTRLNSSAIGWRLKADSHAS